MGVEETQLSMRRTKLIVLATCLYRVRNAHSALSSLLSLPLSQGSLLRTRTKQAVMGAAVSRGAERRYAGYSPSTGIGARIDPTLFRHVSGTEATIAGASFIYRTNPIHRTNEDAV